MAPPWPATRAARRGNPGPPSVLLRPAGRSGGAGAAATVRRRAAQGPGRQPWRDRHPRVPRDVRARHPQRRRLHAGRPRVGAPRQGRRGVRDRRDGPSRAGLPRRRPDRRPGGARRRRRRLPRLRLPLGGPAAGGRLRARRASRSWGPPPRCCARWATRSAPARRPARPDSRWPRRRASSTTRRSPRSWPRSSASRSSSRPRRAAAAAACASCARPARSRTRSRPP